MPPGPASAPDWARWVADYLDELRVVRRASPHTLDATARDLRRLQAMLEGVGHCQSVHIRRWIAALHHDGHQTASLQRYLSSARGFFRFVVGRGGLAHNPTTGVRAPRHRRKLPMGVAADALGQALDQPAVSVVERRDRALLEVLYSSGMRLAEVHGLNLSQVAHGQTELRIVGKGDKERMVWLGGKARAAVDAWLAVRPQWLRATDPGALWLNPRGGCRAAALAWRSRHSPGAPGLRAACIRIACATPSPPTCSKNRVTCAPCKSCWATPSWPPRRFTPMWTSSASPASTTAPTRAPANAAGPTNSVA